MPPTWPMASQIVRLNRAAPQSGHCSPPFEAPSALPVPLRWLLSTSGRCSATRRRRRISPPFLRAIALHCKLFAFNYHSQCVCNCKRRATFFLLHAPCGKRGDSIPPKAARDRDPEIRLAGPLLFGNRFLQGALVADSPRQTQPLAGHDGEAGPSPRR